MAYNDTPLIPRTVLFGNPDRALVKLSPDGSQSRGWPRWMGCSTCGWRRATIRPRPGP